MRAIVQGDQKPVLRTDVAEPRLQTPTDAIVEITMSAAGSADLLFSRGQRHGVAPGIVLGHQAVGRVAALGEQVARVAIGDRVMISPIVACGDCAYCNVGFYAQCIAVNPGEGGFGGVYLGGPTAGGTLDGVHAERARVPFADQGLMRIPDDVSDPLALLLTEQYPLGFFAGKLSLVCAGDKVAVFGAHPAGLMAIATVFMLGAGDVFAVDDDPARLKRAEQLGATPLSATPAEAGDVLRSHLDGRGVQCATLTEGAGMDDGVSRPSADALTSALTALSRDSTLAVCGVYPPDYNHFPLAIATRKYITIKAAACNYTKYVVPMLNLLRSRIMRETVLTQVEDLGMYTEPEHLYEAARGASQRWAATTW